MDGFHDHLPDLSCGVAGEGHIFGSVVAGPDRAGVIRRVAAEPAVAVIGGGAGLACHGHIAQAGFVAGAVGGRVLEHIGHGTGGALRKSGLGLGLVIEDDLAVAVLHHGVASCIGESAVVCKGGVGLGHLTDGDAVVGLAESQSRVVRVRLYEAHDTETARQEVIGRGRRQLIHDLRRNGVLGLLQRGQDGDDAVIGVGRVLRIPRGMRKLDVLVIGVKDKRRRGDQTVFHCRTVDCDGLDGRAGRPCGLGGSVQTEADGLLAGAAAQRLYLAGVLVDDDDAALKLGRGAVAGLGERVKVCVDSVDLCLHIHVDAGVDLVARVVYQASGGLSADALGLGKVAYNVRDNDLLVVGVGSCAGGLVLAADEVELLGLCLLILILVQVALLIHLAQDVLLTRLVVLNAVEGVIVGGKVRDADDGGSLRD